MSQGSIHAAELIAWSVRPAAAAAAAALASVGEATMGRGLNATMEGAILSGRRAAREVLSGVH